MSDEQQPIIIKKIKKGHGGHHGGSWKVAFADFMTAMMAFFLVMWLVGQGDDVKHAVAEYFRDPGKFMQQGKSGVLKGSSAVLKIESGTKIGPVKPKTQKEYIPTNEDARRLALTARNILQKLEKDVSFDKLKNNIKMQLTTEGLRITLNEGSSAAFFEPGSAKLLQRSAGILATIAKELGHLDNRIVVEGHTDGDYTGDGAYSNWELSADRANSARQLMEVSGLHQGQVREVRGMADRFPMIESNPSDPRNRRISLVVLYEAREQMYDQIEVSADFLLGTGSGDS